jgi:hypothetical protein
MASTDRPFPECTPGRSTGSENDSGHVLVLGIFRLHVYDYRRSRLERSMTGGTNESSGRREKRKKRREGEMSSRAARRTKLLCAADEACPPLTTRFFIVSVPPQRPLCSGDGLRAPNTVLGHARWKMAFGRAAGGGQTSGVSQILFWGTRLKML